MKSFDTVSYASPGEVRIPLGVLAQPNKAIRDLLPGQWGFGQENTVNYDIMSRRLLVDSYDRAITKAGKTIIERNPAITRVSAEVGGRAVIGYLADISRINHFLYRGVDIKLENLVTDEHRLNDRRMKLGSELLLGVVFSEFGKLGYSGPAELEERAAEFTAEVESFTNEVYESGESMHVPTHDSEVIKISNSTATAEHSADNADPGSYGA